MENPDAVVIGGGPGGYVAAIRLGQLGKKVVLIERNKLGGECLNYGCIPTKTMIGTAKIADRSVHLAGKGLQGEISVQLPELVDWKNQVVKKLVDGVSNLLKSNGAEVVFGEASITEKHKVEVVTKTGTTESLQASSIIVATGSSPVELPMLRFDHKRVLNNWDVLDLRAVPKRLLVVGGGVVGLEFAFMYAKMGSAITVVEMMDQLLPGMDKEVSEVVLRSARAHGMDIQLKSKVLGGKTQGDMLEVEYETEKGKVTESFSCALISVGRRPNTKGIGLEAAGVTTDPRGFIPVNSRLMTSATGVYAIGDVTPGPMLAHKAMRQGVVVAEVVAGLDSVFDNKVIPDATFTDPEVANAGLSLSAATSAGFKAGSAKFPFAALGRAISEDETNGFVKIVYEEPTKAVLGAQIVGPNASDIISEITLAIEMGATLEDLSATIHPHPTHPEAILEAIEAAEGKSIHMVNRRRSPQ